MEAKNVVKVIPTKQQLLTNNGRVSCTEDGCTKSFIHNGALRMHTVKSHGLIKSESDKCLFHKKKTPDKAVFQFHCPVSLCQYGEGAKKYFNAYSLIKQHYLKVHAERQFRCSQCETAFIREWDLKQHRQRCGVLYRCGTCTVSYTTKEALLTHCKRQQHVYPEEYSRQLKHKTEKQNVNKKPSPAQPVVTIITQPMLLVPIQSKEPVRPPRRIQPKPVTQQSNTIEVTSQQEQDNVSQGNMLSTVRQDAFIQTDIYGVNTLALNQNTAPNHKTLYCRNTHHLNNNVTFSPGQQVSTNVSVQPESHYNAERNYVSLGQRKISPKKVTYFKRRHSQHGDTRPGSPRRKKMKSTTGIQTSVSLTRKKGAPMVNSTQTTGDYIIETALRHANIQIEKKTVASQVTPRKQSDFDCQFNLFEKPKPVLVDSFSQVKQQNIRAETSHNLAESQTMTDLPPSISTQTLQSYLVNLQERHDPSNLSTNMIPKTPPVDIKKPILVDSYTMVNEKPKQYKQTEKPEDNLVQIYGENLDTSVNYAMPHESKQKQNSSSALEGLTHETDNSPMYIATPLNSVHVGIQPPTEKIQAHGVVQKTTFRTDATNVNSRLDEKILPGSSAMEESYLTEHGHMTDVEAQTMSASEFDTLLQSSGIFMNNTDFLTDSTKNQHSTISTQETGTDPSVLAKELGFLGTNTDTIDMNTQTVDLSLFETFVPIDSNTQTGGEGLDFLDMVMTNMETQTLNDDDLASLGLLDGAFTSSSIQTLSSGTVDNNAPECNSVSISCGVGESSVFKDATTVDCGVGVEDSGLFKNSTVTTSTSPCLVEGFLQERKTNKQSDMKNKSVVHSKSSLSEEVDAKVRVQTETQTVSQDMVEPLLQTETQTQVESADTDFERMNMETQTTFEDLEELCDWLK